MPPIHATSRLLRTAAATPTTAVTPWALLALLSVPKAASLFRTFSREIPDAADAITAQLDTIFGVCLMAGLFIAGVVAR